MLSGETSVKEIEDLVQISRTKRYLRCEEQRSKVKTAVSSKPVIAGSNTYSSTKKESFIMDPYSANINPVSELDWKLLLKAIEEITKLAKINVKQAKSKKFVDMMTDNTKNFSWETTLKGYLKAFLNLKTRILMYWSWSKDMKSPLCVVLIPKYHFASST